MINKPLALGHVDVLIVDEAQDLMDTDSYVALDALMVGGWDRGTSFFPYP